MEQNALDYRNNNKTTNPHIEMIAIPGDDAGLAGAEYEFQLIAEPEGCTFTATDLPDYLKMTPEGLIHGFIPEEEANDWIMFNVQVTDPNGNTGSRVIDIYVDEYVN